MLLIDRIMTDAVLVLTAPATAAANELTAAKAVVLGLVEGITEYLPVSSTGHLLVTQKLLDVGDTDATKDAADTYAITIQAGAILAVVVLYFGRLARDGIGPRRSRSRGPAHARRGVDRVPSRGDRRRRAGELDQGPPVRRRSGDRRVDRRRCRDPRRVALAARATARAHRTRADHGADRRDHRCRADPRVVAGHEPQPRDDPRRVVPRHVHVGRARVQLPARVSRRSARPPCSRRSSTAASWSTRTAC